MTEGKAIHINPMSHKFVLKKNEINDACHKLGFFSDFRN